MRFARYPAALRPCWIGRLSAFSLFATAGVLVLGPGSPGCGGPSGRLATKTETVAGRALDLAAAPLACATVELTADPPDGRVPVATAKTSPTGSFRMENVPMGTYRVRARSPAHIEAWARIEVASPGGARVELRLAPSAVLAGHIEDERGTRVPLARVLAFAVAEPGASTVRQTRADDRGEFRLSGLAPGAHRVLIEAPGLGTASAGPLLAPDEKVVVVMPGESRAIVGQVTRGGRPVAAARVLLGGEAVPESRSTETDGEGRFAFGGLGPGSYELWAQAGGFVGPVLMQVIVDRVASQVRTVELVLAPGIFLRGRVQSDDGHAVEGAAIQIDLPSATGLWTAVWSDAHGDWTSTPLPRGTYRVRARHKGFVARRTVSVEIGRTESFPTVPPAPMTLELIRTGEISGRVGDESGMPIAGATVHDRLAETEELGVIWSPLPLAAEAASLPVGAALAATGMGMAGARSVTTEATGRFLLTDVPPGRVRVEVLHPSSLPLRTAPMTLAPGAKLDLGTLRIRGAIQVVGRVTDADGSPLAGVRVSATLSSRSPAGRSPPVSRADPGGELYAVTDSGGGFSLPLPAGEHQLTASAAGRTDVVATVQVGSAGGAAAPVNLRFSKNADLIVEGLVRDSVGRPLGRAEVSLNFSGDIAATGMPRGGSSRVAAGITDAGGHFRLSGLPGHPMSLRVHHANYASYQRTVLPGTATGPLIVEVPIPGAIEGEVHEKSTGAPVPGFEITARGPDTTTTRYPETGHGRKGPAAGPLRFSLRKLAPGAWTLRVRAPGYRDLERAVDVPSAPSPGEVSVHDLRLELERR